MAALADTGEYTADDASREENLRIFQALTGLRRAGIQSRQGADGPRNGPTHRTWGTLCTAYEDQQEARLHAVLRPFLHTSDVAGRPPLRPPLMQRVNRALARIGAMPLCGGDVFELVGAVKGDGAQKIQIFVDPSGECLEEYLLLS